MLIFLFFLIPFYLISEPLKIPVKGKSIILMNAETGAILFDKDAHEINYPASTTKVAAALLALNLKGDQLDLPITVNLDSIVTITQEKKRKLNYTNPAHWLEPDGTHISLKKGETLTFKQLLEGMLIVSGNDASNAIAHTLGPSIPTFMEKLNRYLKEIGCQDTHFTNPHGLHDPRHVSTAYELALITKEALKNSTFREIVMQPIYIRPKTEHHPGATMPQFNRLMRKGQYRYSKAIGVKTGYHAKAKKNLIAAAQHQNRTLIAVLLGYDKRDDLYQDAIKLFDTAFEQSKVKQLFLKDGIQKFTLKIPKANKELKTVLEEPLTLEYYPAENPHAHCLLHWDVPTLPIAAHSKVGTLQLVSKSGQILKSVPLLALHSIDYHWFYRYSTWLAIIFILISLVRPDLV
jgi:serine-type D-Ala-D-Ala carboxypeptidase (penicillin-binding protein 5/6)